MLFNITFNYRLDKSLFTNHCLNTGYGDKIIDLKSRTFFV